MTTQSDTSIQQYLVNIFKTKKAVVFCGAGVSRDYPAGIPNWQKFRDYILEAVASKDKILQWYLADLVSVQMTVPGKKGLAPEVVASSILSNCQKYLECFRAFKDGSPNANHCYLVKMAKAGLLKYIITTNYDVLIEECMKAERIPYRIYITDEEFRSFPYTMNQNKVHILKIHGCITEPSTITATVEQEGKGLGDLKRNALEELLTKYYFVFWGCSGEDLKIDLDYLGMISVKEAAQGFVWNFHNESEYKKLGNEYVKKLVELYGKKARIVLRKLPEIFNKLITQPDTIQRISYSEEKKKLWYKKKVAKLQNALNKWAKEHLRRLSAFHIFGHLLRYSGQMDKALVCYKQAKKIASEIDDRSVLTTSLINIGEIYSYRNKDKRALKYYKKAEEIARAEDNKLGIINCLINFGRIYSIFNKYNRALECYENVEEICRAEGYKHELAACLNNIGTICSGRGEYNRALECYEEAEEICRAEGYKQELATCLNNIGTICSSHGEYNRALKCYREADKIARAIGDKEERATYLNNIGRIYTSLNNFDLALECYKEAEEIARAIHNKNILLTVLNNMADFYITRKEYERALECYKEAEKIAHEIGEKNKRIIILNNIGWIYFYYIRKDYQALKYYFKAWFIAKTCEDADMIRKNIIKVILNSSELCSLIQWIIAIIVVIILYFIVYLTK